VAQRGLAASAKEAVMLSEHRDRRIPALVEQGKIGTLQRKLYCKSKDEPDYRFYLLYDKVYREDLLLDAYELAKSNQGAPGVDGETFAAIRLKGLGSG
jgi:RNA-directed DNA polymerase